MKSKILGLLAVGLLAATATGQATTINFDDGTAGASIGAFYSSLGVTFTNASWDAFVSFNEGSVGAGGLKLVSSLPSLDRYRPTPASPIVATFSSSMANVSIRGLNVGANGARMDVFDAETGGTLLGSFQAFGIDAGVTNHPLLIANLSNIRRIELYQPLAVLEEGLLFDILSFDAASVPEPGTLALLGLGLLGLGLTRRKAA